MEGGVELEFRDGTFVVPDHLAALMTELDTTRYCYAAAVELVNSSMLGQYIGRVQTDTVRRHFEQVRDDGNRR